MTSRAACAAAALCATRVATAQPLEPAPEPPLAEVKGDQAIAEELAQITSDPAIRVEDPAMRKLAQALMVEGVRQLRAKAFDQALANFLEAYGKFPSPKILLNIGSTLRDMGRSADAANTYARYLSDPATGRDRVPEVQELLQQLDAQLTILDVSVTPRGCDVSIDGGPFVPVGQWLLTRVRPGLHLLRVRKGDRSAELTINGFEGETKRVDARLDLAEPGPAPPITGAPEVTPAPIAGAPEVTPTPTPAGAPGAPPERVQPWLTNGTQYSADAAGGNVRRARSGYGGSEIAPVIPQFEMDDGDAVRLQYPERTAITSGAIALLRIDGKLRGFAGGAGLALSRGRLEGDLMLLRSEVTGAYVGARFRILTGLLRPYVAAGMPGFLYDDMGTTKLAFGVRAAAGLEVRVNAHLSIQGDLGYEHFFGVEDTAFESDVFVPTLGVIGRL